jgi:hypothetical protein
MFRKLILAAVLAAGTFTGFAAVPNAANAHPPAIAHRHGFEVSHRRGGRWDAHDRYFHRFEARYVAWNRHR